jgi:hypothetical protein
MLVKLPKIRSLAIFAGLLSLTLAGCFEGAQGPQGPPGPQG